MPFAPEKCAPQNPFRNRNANGNNPFERPNCTLYITGIPMELSSNGLKNLFQSYGSVTRARVLPPKNKELEVCAGFITYEKLDEAEAAIHNLNGSCIGQSVLRIEPAKVQQRNETSNFSELIHKLEKGKLGDEDLNSLLQKDDGNGGRKSSWVNRSPFSNNSNADRDFGGRNANCAKDLFSGRQETAYHPERKQKSKGTNCKICSKATMNICSSCSSVHYCSQACQITDWPEHKKICSKLAKESHGDDEPFVITNCKTEQVQNVCTPEQQDVIHGKEVKTNAIETDNKCSQQSKCTLKLLSPSVAVGQILHLMVTDLDAKSCSMLCQNADASFVESLNAMQRSLDVHYSSTSGLPISNVSIGDSCAALFSEDGKWYRAVVENIHDQGLCDIRFIDYGNVETTKSEKMKVLEETFLSHPAFSIKCKLADVDSTSGWSDNMVAFLSTTLQENNLLIKAEITGVDGSCVYIKCVSGETCINDTAVKQCLVKPVSATTGESEIVTPKKVTPKKESDEAPCTIVKSSRAENSSNIEADKQKSSPSDKPKETKHQKRLAEFELLDESLTILVSHVEDPSTFYCQAVQDGLFQLNDMMKKLTLLYASDAKRVAYTPEAGEFCAGLFEEDGMWYRCEVLQVSDSGSCKVCYVDFGNTADLAKNQVQPLPIDCFSLPKQAFKAGLANCYPLSGNKWSEEAILLMKSFQNKSLFAKMDRGSSVNGLISLVVFVDESLTLNDNLISSKIATDKKPQCNEDSEMELQKSENNETKHAPRIRVKVNYGGSEGSAQMNMDNVVTINATVSSKFLSEGVSVPILINLLVENSD